MHRRDIRSLFLLPTCRKLVRHLAGPERLQAKVARSSLRSPWAFPTLTPPVPPVRRSFGIIDNPPPTVHISQRPSHPHPGPVQRQSSFADIERIVLFIREFLNLLPFDPASSRFVSHLAGLDPRFSSISVFSCDTSR